MRPGDQPPVYPSNFLVCGVVFFVVAVRNN